MSFKVAKSYIELNGILGGFVEYISEHRERLKISAEQVSELRAEQVRWEAAWEKYSDQYRQTVPVRAEQRAIYERLNRYVHGLRQYIKGNVLVGLTDADYEELQIHRDKTTRTAAVRPTLVPRIELTTSRSLYIELRIVYETEEEGKMSKIPPGAKHIELEQAICDTDVPDSVSEFMRVYGAVHGITRLTYERSQANKFAIFRARYLNSRAEGGPWSEMRAVAINE